MSQQKIYTYHPHFIFRAPLLPFPDETMDAAKLFEYSKNEFFKEAIYLASPVLYDELIKWHKGERRENEKQSEKEEKNGNEKEKEKERLIISLYKYYIRMCSRSTPYGLFAGCGTAKWGTENNIVTDGLKRHTRLDMNYLCSLSQQLNSSAAVFKLARFYPNNSIYRLGNSIRYVEYKYVNNNRRHHLSSVEHTPELQLVLDKAASGALTSELCSLLISDEISREEAEGYIAALIENQLLVSELEPAVTGEEFIQQVIFSLRKMTTGENNTELTEIASRLEQACERITRLDQNIENDVSIYRDIYNELKSFETPMQENQLFQTDLYKTAVGSLNSRIQDELRGGIDFLNRFFKRGMNSTLEKFKSAFLERYEQAEVPLLQALDTESGIGYGNRDSSGINRFVDHLFFADKNTSSTIPWDSRQELLHRKLKEASLNNDYEIRFTDADLGGEDYSTPLLPDSLTLMFRVIDDNTIFIQSCGGSSAANLLGRFASGNEEIHSVIKEITAHEQLLHSDKVLAEIVHLPESRTGNILLRPALRDYEIPYLGKSSLPKENQLDVNDLFVSVRNNKVILRSGKLNKEVLPQLSTAHNYTRNALPVYQFLCDLQVQRNEKSGLFFQWGSLSSSYTFLPRASFKNVVLSRAKWQLPASDLPASAEAVKEWAAKWKMPRYILLTESDNELLIDLENELSRKMLISSVKKREKVIIEEFLFDPAKAILKNTPGEGFANEFIAMLLKNNLQEQPVQTVVSAAPAQEIVREFHIGSEWLYYKIYSGAKTADKILAEIIKPLAEKFADKRLTDQFFFIRYNDPEAHIRVRFHVCNAAAIATIIQQINTAVTPYTQQGLVTKVQTDTYKRELERYGVNSMALSESLFHTDSICTLSMLDMVDENEGEEARWLFALRSMDDLLDYFSYPAKEKLSFLERQKEGFANEHGNTKELKVQLDDKFRGIRTKVESIMDRTKDEEKEILPLLELLEWKREMLKEVVQGILQLRESGQLQVELNSLVASYIHMMINRIFRSKQRTYELVLYDILYRYYKSMLARREKQQAVKIVQNVS